MLAGSALGDYCATMETGNVVVVFQDPPLSFAVDYSADLTNWKRYLSMQSPVPFSQFQIQVNPTNTAQRFWRAVPQ